MMCPLWPLHIVLLYLLTLWPLWFAVCQLTGPSSKKARSSWSAVYDPPVPPPLIAGASPLSFRFSGSPGPDRPLPTNFILTADTDDPGVATVSQPQDVLIKNDTLSGSFNVTGHFLGYTSVRLCLRDKRDWDRDVRRGECLKPGLRVAVVRQKTRLDSVFTVSVIVLVSVIFINFGCALDLGGLKKAITTPVGPLIGLVSHFLFLPLLSYGLGLLLFPDSPAMRLGLFFTGIAPAGGASNIWTYSLGGNLTLSITMTAISTLASFFMIPLWVFTLGQEIFSSSHLSVPYRKLLTSALGLVLPLAVGYAIQVKYKKLSGLMVRVLKPFSAFLILFIVIFAIVTNLYLFQLFTWQILAAGLGLPWLGYMCGLLLATFLGQSFPDTLAIAIETGVQNTGISIFLLRTCLPQPDADLTTAAPVAVALMTPLPLLMLVLVKRLFCKQQTRGQHCKEQQLSAEDNIAWVESCQSHTRTQPPPSKY